MKDFVRFEDLKIGEQYDIYTGEAPERLYIKGVVLECGLTKGEKVFRSQENSRYTIVFSEYDKINVKFTHIKNPLLTDESIGKEFTCECKNDYKIVGKATLEGEEYFVGCDIEDLLWFFTEDGRAYDFFRNKLEQCNWKLTK